MIGARTRWRGAALLAGFGAAALATAPITVEPAVGIGAGIAVGGAVAATLFLLLAQRLPPAVPRADLPRVAARATFLAVRSFGEEVVWRWLVLAGLAPRAGMGAACAVSTAGFALSHAGGGKRAVGVHLVTGAAFAATFVATGRLSAAVVAHAGYNALVSVAVAGEQPRAAAAATAACVAELVRVRKSFPSGDALRDVDLSLRAGEAVALLGPNGAGKTTALSILLGLRRPDAGAARLFGDDPRRPSARRFVAATPQETGVSPTLTVTELVELVAAHYEDPLPTLELLEQFQLEGVAKRQGGGLSGGERRRLALALAFVGRPRLAVLDEPTAGLDVESRLALWHTLDEYVAEGGTLLLTTHDLHEAETIARRIVVLASGTVVADAPPAEIKARAGFRRIRLREQELPLLEGVVRSARDGARIVLDVEAVAPVVRALVAARADLEELEVLPVTLEEAFLALTEKAG